MRKTIGRISLIFIATLAAAQAQTPVSARPVQLDRGMPIGLTLVSGLSSADAQRGDRVEFEVTSDVELNGAVAVSRGSSAWGVVVDASPRSRMGRNGKLAIDIAGVCAVDGRALPLVSFDPTQPSGRSQASAPRKSASDNGTDNILALPALPVMLFMYGKDVTVPAGKFVTVYSAKSTTLNAMRVGTAAPSRKCSNGTAPQGPAASELATTASVAIRSAPDAAEILVDGVFRGNTPAILKLTPGDHTVSLIAPRRLKWERTMHMDAGSQVTLAPVLAEVPTGSAVAQNTAQVK